MIKAEKAAKKVLKSRTYCPTNDAIQLFGGTLVALHYVNS